MTDSTGTAVREYDGLNRAVTKTVPGIGISYYDYDIITDVGEGEIAETTTDPKGNTTTKVYDRAGRLKEVRTENGTTTYTYYDNGAKQSVVYPDGSREEYTYYPDNTLHTLTNRKLDSAVIDTYSYTYDAANNQTSKADSRGTTSYTYDGLNRLETVSEPSGKLTEYTFDPAGNRAAETVTQSVYDSVYSTYSYNEQNRLMEILTWANGIQTERVIFTYDNNGNQLSVTKSVYEDVYGSLSVTINEYDLFNQLIKTTTPDNKVITNTYDGEGKRTAKDVDGETTRYLYEYDKVILELDGEGGQKARNAHGTSLISRDVEGLTGYYFYNGHGDVTVIQDVYSNQLALYYYDAFGNPESVTESVYGSVYNTYTYAGYMWDEETGTYYLMARMYDPETARFLQEDTYRGDPNDPLSLNLYTYCHNEPIMYTDPDGHSPKELEDIINTIDRFKKGWKSNIRLRDKISEWAQQQRERLTEQEEYKGEYKELVDRLIAGEGKSKDENWDYFKKVTRYVIQRGKDKEFNWNNISEGVKLGASLVPEYVVQELKGEDVEGNMEKAAKSSSDLSKYNDGYTVKEISGGATLAGVIFMTQMAKSGGKPKIVRPKKLPINTKFKQKQGNTNQGMGTTNIFGKNVSETLKASELRKYAQSQGWKKVQTDSGPEKWLDKNGIARVTIKKGSSRTPGSENPHVEIRDASGQRIDPLGNPVSKRSTGNHTSIEYDIKK